jgi:hypothetical protein
MLVVSVIKNAIGRDTVISYILNQFIIINLGDTVMVPKVKSPADVKVRMISSKRLKADLKAGSLDEKERVKLLEKIEALEKELQEITGTDPWSRMQRSARSSSKFRFEMDLAKLESEMEEKARRYEAKISHNLSILQSKKAA